MLHIDGSTGEGGGQMLRSSLALSIATGTPVRVSSIRAKRERPGLLRQHLTCVQAAAAICGAEVTGAAVGSSMITFVPGPPRAGEYAFAVGTAGSTTLVLQAILPALLIADGASRVTIEGGTHNVSAPPFNFFERSLLPIVNRSGAVLAARLERHGFYPAGGGRVVVEVTPASTPRAICILDRGERTGAHGIALVSRLSRSIAEREIEHLQAACGLEVEQTSFVHVTDAAGPGNAAIVELFYEHITEVFSSVGQIGKPAETVASDLAAEVREYFRVGRPVGKYLADQLMVPLLLLAGGRYSTGPLSEHARTNIDVIRAFGGRVSVVDDVVDVEPLRR